MKQCYKCNLQLSYDNFHKNKSKKDGLNNFCKKCIKNYYLKNKLQILNYHKKYYNQNKNKILCNTLKYEKIRISKDPIYRLIKYRRRRRLFVLKNINKNHTLKDLGSSIQEWKQYLESKFDENMTWENYGSYWHLDEVIPCTSWNFSNEIEQKACFHYLNSQPLEAKINLSKGGANRKDYTKEKAQFLMILKALGEI